MFNGCVGFVGVVGVDGTDGTGGGIVVDGEADGVDEDKKDEKDVKEDRDIVLELFVVVVVVELGIGRVVFGKLGPVGDVGVEDAG